jgi:hypothetical protein
MLMRICDEGRMQHCIERLAVGGSAATGPWLAQLKELASPEEII